MEDIKLGGSPHAAAEFVTHAKHVKGIHTVLTRIFKSISDNIKTVKEEDYSDFIDYIAAGCQCLHHHHDTEEEIEFPMISKTKDTKGAANVTERCEEHKVLLVCLNKMDEIIKEFRQNKKVDMTELTKHVQTITDFIQTHFAEEENFCTAEWMAANLTVKEIKDCGKAIAAKVKKGDPFTDLPIIFYNISLEEKVLYSFPPVPCFVSKFLVPFVFSKKHKKMWRFASFPPKQ